MCGLCGFLGPEMEVEDLIAGRAMRDILRHRGPDGQGELELRPHGGPRSLRGWLGHRRLKIIDLSPAAHQPMTSDDGALALVYNGEVYNFRELRTDLAARGHSFRSSGDTEVVLRAYEEWGEGFLERLDGMFALALWDGRSARLLLARDRVGKKPLFYTLLGGRLTFGSEIKSVLAAPWVMTRPDPSRVPELLTYGYVPEPATMYDGISQVPAASFVIYSSDGLDGPHRYWDSLEVPATDGSRREVPLEARVATLFREAVRRRLVADVPLGALLSGGVDSSLVVGLMSQVSPDPVHTFSIGFPEEPSYDERGHARRVADHFGTHHTEFAVKADAAGLLDTLLWHHDQPFGDTSAVPTYLVSRLAREHVTVVLNGDGGDEVFGGYERFVAARLARLIPAPLGGLVARGVGLLPRSDHYYGMRRRAERFFELSHLPVRDRYQAWIALLGRPLLSDLLRPELRTDVLDGAVMRSMNVSYERARGRPELDQILYANFKTYLPDDLAVKMDRMSMAHSLEARSPFLDRALIECLAGVPARDKVGLRRLKPILRRAFFPLLPPEIWNRRKHGFGVPIGHWFRGDLGTMFEDEVLAPSARTRALLEPAALAEVWRSHQERQADHGHALWAVLTLERWLRSAGRPIAPGPPREEPIAA